MLLPCTWKRAYSTQWSTPVGAAPCPPARQDQNEDVFNAFLLSTLKKPFFHPTSRYPAQQWRQGVANSPPSASHWCWPQSASLTYLNLVRVLMSTLIALPALILQTFAPVFTTANAKSGSFLIAAACASIGWICRIQHEALARRASWERALGELQQELHHQLWP